VILLGFLSSIDRLYIDTNKLKRFDDIASALLLKGYFVATKEDREKIIKRLKRKIRMVSPQKTVKIRINAIRKDEDYMAEITKGLDKKEVKKIIDDYYKSIKPGATKI
jgi:hypothetical protein